MELLDEGKKRCAGALMDLKVAFMDLHGALRRMKHSARGCTRLIKWLPYVNHLAAARQAPTPLKSCFPQRNCHAWQNICTPDSTKDIPLRLPTRNPYRYLSTPGIINKLPAHAFFYLIYSRKMCTNARHICLPRELRVIRLFTNALV